MELKATIPLGIKNRNGRIYTAESFSSDEYNVPVFIDWSDDRDLSNIVGKSKVTIEDDSLVMDINIDRKVDLLKNCVDRMSAVFCVNHATVDNNGVVTNGDITEVFFTNNSAFSDSTLVMSNCN